MILSSPAKLNLFFRVLAKRRDGYHDIASLYSKISLHDSLRIELSSHDGFSFESHFSLPDFQKDNLVLKARDLFRNATNIHEPISIHLTKQIPLQAGLGGGSSNAATTLLALNELFDFPLNGSELMRLAAKLGSDVSFFLSSGLAYCTGRGEIIQEIPSPLSYTLYVAKPTLLFLSTPIVYQNCKPNELSDQDPQQLLDLHLKGTPIFVNDLEPAAFRLLPSLATIKKNLLALGFDHVTMTGSGTAFFCIGSVTSPELSGIDFYKARLINE